MHSWPRLDLVYSFLWSLLALFVPLVILTVCNVCLIRALQQSRRLQSQCRASCRSEAVTVETGGRKATGSGNNGQQRITPTLVALIVVFTVCVGPSGLLERALEKRPAPAANIYADGTFQAAGQIGRRTFRKDLPYSWMDGVG